jgi:hypothetical protein
MCSNCKSGEREKYWQEIAGRLASYCNSIYLSFQTDGTQDDKDMAHGMWIYALEFLDFDEAK